MVNAAYAEAARAAAPTLISVFPAISNRHCWRLETSVTSRKQSTDPILIDTNFAQIGLRPSRACGNYVQLASHTSKSATVSSNPLHPFFLIASRPVLEIELTRSQ